MNRHRWLTKNQVEGEEFPHESFIMYELIIINCNNNNNLFSVYFNVKRFSVILNRPFVSYNRRRDGRENCGMSWNHSN